MAPNLRTTGNQAPDEMKFPSHTLSSLTTMPTQPLTRGRGTVSRSRGRATSTRGREIASTRKVSARPPPKQFHDGLDPAPFRTLEKPKDSPGPEVQITDLSYIGSYNWVLDDRQRTIIVPGESMNSMLAMKDILMTQKSQGAPPEWKNKPLPYTVEPDKGLSYIDQNGYRLPSTPLLPLFRAVDTTSELTNNTIDWSSVDFITDRNNLRKLLRWVRAEGVSGKSKEFRIDLQLAGSRTVLMNRWDYKTTAWSNGDVNPAYGHNFEKTSTHPVKGCEKTSGHNRIVKYKLGNFTMIVRFDVDAYLPESGKVSMIPSDPTDAQLDKLLHGLSISPAPQATPEASISTVHEVRRGAYIPQNCIMELMARNQKNASFQWSETYPQLFFSQTPHFYMAVQTGGNFTALKRKSLQDQDVRNVGSGLQGDFRKLLIALEGIQKAMIESGQEGRCTLVHEGGELKVFNRLAQNSCLPQEILDRFK